MERYKINRNNAKTEYVDILSITETNSGVTTDGDIKIVCPNHHAYENEILFFRKRSGTDEDETQWGAYVEEQVRVVEVVDENTLIVRMPRKDVKYTIKSIEDEKDGNGSISGYVASFNEEVGFLPEDFHEYKEYSGKMVSATAITMVTSESATQSAIVMGTVYPVYRHIGASIGNIEYDSDYDRDDINTSEYEFPKTGNTFPKISKYTYIKEESLTTSETSYTLVEKVPEDSAITSSARIYIYTTALTDTCDEEGILITSKTYYHKEKKNVYDEDKLRNYEVSFSVNPFYYADSGNTNVVHFFSSVDLIRKRSYYEIDMPLYEQNELNLLQENNVNEYFADEIKANIIPDVIDMEKVVFEPSIDATGGKMVSEIEFNFHFRTREVGDYEEIPDNELVDEVLTLAESGTTTNKKIENKYIYTKNQSTNETKYYRIGYKEGWIVTTSNTWNNISCGTYTSGINFAKSDLIGYLNFNDDDIRYQKQKVKKSFIRLSFYDSANPLTQQLLFYSTIFLDATNLAGKYNRNKIKNKKFNVFTDNDDETARISTRLTVKDRYNTDKSSEGFYLYLFNSEVTKESVSKTIYMKVEYNHAGYGRTLIFGKPYIDANYKIQPIPFKEYFDNLYIKLGIAYNGGSESPYIYYVDESSNNTWLAIDSSDEGKITFNLFEVIVSD